MPEQLPIAITIPLKHGQFALVDLADYDRVMQYKWTAAWLKTGWYVLRWVPETKSTQYLHRFIVGAKRGQLVDHRNGNALDCRRDNLRIATPSQNSMNRRPKSRALRYKGVRLHDGRWQARISVGGDHIDLGRFDTPEQAAQAYDEAAIKYHGEFARLNFRRCA